MKKNKIDENTENRIREFNQFLDDNGYDTINLEECSRTDAVAEVANRINAVSENVVEMSGESSLHDPEFIQCLEIVSAGAEIVDDEEDSVENYEQKFVESMLSKFS
jgi:hypothetical protein